MSQRPPSLDLPALTRWYRANARDLPWRAPQTGAWPVLVSEVMLQQTQVSRVLPVYEDWLARWPNPAACAEASLSEVLRVWGRLGYPRRARRLHLAAIAIRDEHGGTVPADLDALRRLPGVGEYTAAAVAAFAYSRRHPVLDTNVRRVLARVLSVQALPPPAITRAERSVAATVLPDDGRAAALASVALMELGALVCTARTPKCPSCPLRPSCAWRRAGFPPSETRRPQPAYQGSDRQARGTVLAELRRGEHPLELADLSRAWPEASQLERALAGLLADGLVEAVGSAYRLPEPARASGDSTRASATR